MSHRTRVIASTALFISWASCLAGSAQDYVWWEGEAAIEHNFPTETPYATNTLDATGLSAGNWLSATGNRYGPTLFARYKVEVPRAGTYSFRVRKFWKHGPFRWRFDDQPWRECTSQVALLDSVYLRKFVCANWVSLSEVTLTAGTHTLHIENTDAVMEKPEMEAKPVQPLCRERQTMQIADWCTATYPARAAVGQKLPIQLAYDVPLKTHLCCELLWKKNDKGFGGFMTSGRPFPLVEGKGEYTFELLVQDKGVSLGSVFVATYLSPEGHSKAATHNGKQFSMPVDPDSIPKPIHGASAIAFDCFLLTDKPFVARGKLRPGEKYNRSPEGWFAFEPDPDPFDASALLDLRSMNHQFCGEKGRLQTMGPSFVFEKEPGKPVKFWGDCVGTATHDKATTDDFARRVAKLGINMVRHHGAFHGGVAEDPLGISDDYVDHFNYFVAALKKNGVYLMLNIYYDHFFTTGKWMEQFGYRQGMHAPHFLFIHPEGHALWKKWAARLLDVHNPYTGMRNADDPTIAIVQVVNEDNYFWHTFRPHQDIPGPVMSVLEDRFAKWLIARYGSIEKATTAWEPDGVLGQVKGDDLANGRVGIIGPGTLSRMGRNPQRRCDTAQFLTEDLRSVFRQFQDYLAQDLGCKALVNGGNWLCANRSNLEPLDKYANMGCDVMDRHGVGWYKGPIRLAKTWESNKGDLFRSLSPLKDPEGTPLTDMQYNDMVHVISEPKSPMPNRFRSDWLPLLAVYGSIQGTDAFTHFAGRALWAQTHGRWSLDTPAQMGQSPATSLIFRNGYIDEGPTVVDESLKLADLYALRGAATSGTLGMDEMTVANVREDGLGAVEDLNTIDPLTFFVGKVRRSITEKGGVSRMSDLAAFIDRAGKTIRSANGQVTWDYGDGILRIHAPCAQGAVGFLRAGGSQALGDVVVNSDMEYGSILVVSMDGNPLMTSRRILLQAMSEDINYGWQTKPARGQVSRDGKKVDVDCEEIVETGSPPIVVRNIEGSVILKRPDAGDLKVTALDFNGYRRQDLARGQGDRLTFELLPDCFYYIVALKEGP